MHAGYIRSGSELDTPQRPAELVSCPVFIPAVHLGTSSGGIGLAPDPSLPRIPTRIAPARRAQKDGWILSINNQQSKARNHYVFLSMLCFKAPDSSLQKVAPVQMCWIHHMGR
ncbi:uncharacterized protein AKAME5_001133500 [Lates japonicus]|uniref:Uncharacterized protein n=1 Tax=Lates japonicus TaxID=270547 RepID=A0AAD3MQQ7_LATJO|nr:uncharacterized protein AKAME5_001133500 [Lates japonicus]